MHCCAALSKPLEPVPLSSHVLSRIDCSLAQQIELEPTNSSGRDPRPLLIFEGKSVGGTLNHACATPDAAVAMSDLDLAYILAFFKTRFGTDLPAKVDALATFGIERDVPARLL